MQSMEAISKGIRVDTILKAVPPGVRRLIISPHGPLMAVSVHFNVLACVSLTCCFYANMNSWKQKD